MRRVGDSWVNQRRNYRVLCGVVRRHQTPDPPATYPRHWGVHRCVYIDRSLLRCLAVKAGQIIIMILSRKFTSQHPVPHRLKRHTRRCSFTLVYTIFIADLNRQWNIHVYMVISHESGANGFFSP